jgi:hypothetical protein
MQYQKIGNLIDEYAKPILEAGFTLERLDEGENAKLLIELDSMEDLKRLADAVERNIVFESQRSCNGIYPILTIYL